MCMVWVLDLILVVLGVVLVVLVRWVDFRVPSRERLSAHDTTFFVEGVSIQSSVDPLKG